MYSKASIPLQSSERSTVGLSFSFGMKGYQKAIRWKVIICYLDQGDTYGNFGRNLTLLRMNDIMNKTGEVLFRNVTFLGAMTEVGTKKILINIKKTIYLLCYHAFDD